MDVHREYVRQLGFLCIYTNTVLGGPNEKDRHLLVEFDQVIQEFQRLGDGYVPRPLRRNVY